MVRIINVFIFVLLTTLGFSQEMKIQGNVVDTTNNRGALKNAVAMLVRMRDNKMIDFRRTDENGYFIFDKVPMDTVTLTIAHPGYEDREIYIVGTPENLDINIPELRMYKPAQQIDEVMIFAYKTPIYYKGDTLVYVADSFKVHENATVEELLKKLPGIEVDERGNIKSQGQEIAKVLVDGDEFFGSDPTIATKNLGAKAVESVQVYEKTQDGVFGSDEKIKVLDLKLKEEYKSGYFGRVSGASDFALMRKNNPFYEGEVLFNYFKGSTKISVFGLATNTPRNSFGWTDVSRFGLENEASGDPWNSTTTTNNGIPRTLKTGFYYADKYGKKKNTALQLNYTYYNNEMDSRSASRTQFFLTDTTYFTDDSIRNLNKTESHRLNLTIETKLDSLTKLKIKPTLSIDQAQTKYYSFTEYRTPQDLATLGTDINNTSKSDGLNVSTLVNFERKFKKPRRVFTFDYYFNHIDNKTKNNLLTNSRIYAIDFNTLVNQDKNNINKQTLNNFYVDYTEPLNKVFRLTAGYNFMIEKMNLNKKTYDFDSLTGVYSSVNLGLSNEFVTNRMEHKGGLKLSLDKGKHNAFARVDVRNVSIENFNILTSNTINQNVTNLLPSARYEYKPSMGMRLRMDYTTSAAQPSISNLAPVPDNTNPNRIVIGNMDLKPSYTHNFSFNFNKFNPMNSSFVWLGGFGSLTQNAFSTATNFDQMGRMVSQTINVNGVAYTGVYAGGGVPIKGREISFRPMVMANYNRMVNQVNLEENVTNYLSLLAKGEFVFQWDSLEFNLSGQVEYINPKSTISSVSSTPYYKQTYTARVMWRIGKGFELRTDARYVLNSRLADGYNLNYLLWNAEISKNFLKTENLILSVLANDILNQNTNAARTVTNNMVVDNRTELISRYFLLKLTYRFNSNKTKDEDPKSHY